MSIPTNLLSWTRCTLVNAASVVVWNSTCLSCYMQSWLGEIILAGYHTPVGYLVLTEYVKWKQWLTIGNVSSHFAVDALGHG